MAKFTDIQARDIGLKFGKSTDEFATASNNALEACVMQWSNDGIDIMRKIIQRNARTKGASTLALDMDVQPAKKEGNGISVAVTSGQLYADYRDKGVRGLKGNKAPGSPYKFKNLGTSKAMVDSFKDYIARTGTKSFGGTRLILKNKKKQADRMTVAAKQMAVATKISGIKPMRFINAATNDKRKKDLSKSIRESIGSVLRVQIVQTAK